MSAMHCRLARAPSRVDALPRPCASTDPTHVETPKNGSRRNQAMRTNASPVFDPVLFGLSSLSLVAPGRSVPSHRHKLHHAPFSSFRFRKQGGASRRHVGSHVVSPAACLFFDRLALHPQKGGRKRRRRVQGQREEGG
eukprot:scaffold627_cov247-Pavlova_lutheri.AAC.2